MPEDNDEAALFPDPAKPRTIVNSNTEFTSEPRPCTDVDPIDADIADWKAAATGPMEARFSATVSLRDWPISGGNTSTANRLAWISTPSLKAFKRAPA